MLNKRMKQPRSILGKLVSIQLEEANRVHDTGLKSGQDLVKIDAIAARLIRSASDLTQDSSANPGLIGDIYAPFLYLATERLFRKGFIFTADQLGMPDYEQFASRKVRVPVRTRVAGDIDACLLSRYGLYLDARRDNLERFKEASQLLFTGRSVAASSFFIPLHNGRGGYSLDMEPVPGLETLIGKIIFRSSDNYSVAYRSLSRYFRWKLGQSRFSAPIREITCSDGDYFVMQQGQEDLEVALRERKRSPQQIFDALAQQILMHSSLQTMLYEDSDPVEEGREIVFAAIDSPSAIFDNFAVGQSLIGMHNKQSHLVRYHDYDAEFEISMIVGREGEKDRLAQRTQYEIKDDRRRYITGSNDGIDGLIKQARAFSRAFLTSGMAAVRWLNHAPEADFPLTSTDGSSNELLDYVLTDIADLDCQPSNYLMDGKLTDLVKLACVNSLYTAARLAYHPQTMKFLTEHKKDLFDMLFDYGKRNSAPLIDASISRLTSNPALAVDGNVLFGLFLSSKIISSGVPIDEVCLHEAYKMFEAHGAWINAFHVFSYECRADDRRSSLEYLDAALSIMESDKRYQPFREAYVAAIMDSKHTSHKEFITRRSAKIK